MKRDPSTQREHLKELILFGLVWKKLSSMSLTCQQRSIGSLLELSERLETKGNVDHAGLFQQLQLWKAITRSRVASFLIWLSSSASIVIRTP